MERVLCQCAACDAKVGIYTNLWLQIGKGYYCPVLNDEAEAAHVVKGSQRDGEEGTLVAEWHVFLDCTALIVPSDTK
jgi:hypothetical protein